MSVVPSAGQPRPAILIVGASRGLGHAMAAEFVQKGWNVVGTVRGDARTELHDLMDQHPAQVEIEHLDMNDPAQIAALREGLAGRMFDIVFVNAGTTVRDQATQIGQVTTEEFIHVMVTNALSPMRVVDALKDLVPLTGLIGIMSSGQGSITNNIRGLREVYRGSKAALNQYMRSFAAREAEAQRAMVLMAPGWVRTELGGAEAPLTIQDSVPNLVNVLLSKQGRPGLEYLDYLGRTVPW